MGGRRKPNTRREPVFDVTPGPEPRAGAEDTRADPPRIAADDEEAPPKPRPRKRRKRAKSGKSGGGKRRSGFGRIVYWGVVVSLWGVIALIGGAVWVGAHLPAIQALEIPKRP